MTKRATDIAVITNARAAGQRSMIGYGKLVLEAAWRTGASAVEWRGASVLGGRRDGNGIGKLARSIDRFALTPLAMLGRRARLVHIVDPGNAVYLDLVRKDCAVVTVHDMIPYLAAAGRLDGFKPTRNGRLLMSSIVSCLRRVDRIICVSEKTHADVLALVDPDPARVVTIHNAVFQPLAPAPEAEQATLRRTLRLDPKARIVLHIGRNFYKNHAAVLEVFAKIARTRSDLILVFVMPPIAALTDAITRHGLEERVHVIPFVPADDMAALYTTASLLLFPSLYEGFGYPVLEAQLCGTPVVCSNAGALPEVAGEGARLLAPDDNAGMAEAAAALLDDPQEAGSLVECGRRNARRFDRDAWFAQHGALYNELGVPSLRGSDLPIECTKVPS